MRSQHSRQNILCGNRVQKPWDLCAVTHSGVWFMNGNDWKIPFETSVLVKLKTVMCTYKVLVAESVCSLVSTHDLMKSTKTADNFPHAIGTCVFAALTHLWTLVPFWHLQEEHLRLQCLPCNPESTLTLCCRRQLMKELWHKTKHNPGSRRQFDHESYYFLWSVEKKECNAKSH